MKCPKCGYVSHAYLDQCKKCGRDLSKYKKEFSFVAVKPGAIDISQLIVKVQEEVSAPLAAEEGPEQEPEGEKVTSLEEELPAPAAQAEEISIDEIEFDLGRAEEAKAPEAAEELVEKAAVVQKPQPVSRPGHAAEEIEFDLGESEKEKAEDVEVQKEVALPQAAVAGEAEPELRPEDIDLDIGEVEEDVTKVRPVAEELTELSELSLDDLPIEEKDEAGEAEEKQKGEEKAEGIDEIDFELEEEDLGDIGEEKTS